MPSNHEVSLHFFYFEHTVNLKWLCSAVEQLQEFLLRECSELRINNQRSAWNKALSDFSKILSKPGLKYLEPSTLYSVRLVFIILVHKELVVITSLFET